jgi:hypothetical protein
MEINNQYDFFQNVQLDSGGNLLVSIVGSGGTAGNNYYTTAATLSGTVVTFDRTDLINAYSVDLASIAGSGLNLDGGYPSSILMEPNYEGGFYNSIAIDTIDGGGV